MESNLASRIIPCLDVKEGRVVKGINFLNLRDAGDPIEIAHYYSDQGADELAFLDITATSDNKDLMLSMIEKVASKIFIPLTVGGGVRQVSDIQRLLNAGADKISINSAAVSRPDLVKEAAMHYGSQCIVVAIDAIRCNSEDRWVISTHGGRNITKLDAVHWACQMVSCGAGELLITSMNQDGTKSGFDINLTRAVSDSVSVPVIASGGAGTLQHLSDALIIGRANAVLAASIFHYDQCTIRQCKNFLKKQGIAIRL